jgi:hypothetical protein
VSTLLPRVPRRAPAMSMLLVSATPSEFLATHLAAHLNRFDAAGQTMPDSRWASPCELLHDDAALLRRCHHSLVEDQGTPPAAAAKYLAGWFGGRLGEAIGFVFAAGAAGVLADSSLRWCHLAGGHVEHIDLSRCRIVVTADHPWAGQPGTSVLDDADAVRDAVVAGLRSVLTPILQVLRSMAKVGSNSLWSEVADGLGMSFAFTPRLGQAPSALTPLEYLLNSPGAPWKAKPLVWVADTGCGPFVMARKGGCCLAYTAPDDESACAEADLGEYERAYLKRFPRRPGLPSYCSTCSFRDLEDVEARQRFWLQHRDGRDAGGA